MRRRALITNAADGGRFGFFGTLEGPDETMFGGVTAMEPDGAGGVYLYDYQVPAIRHFGADGAFLQQIGREGQGPGEYLDAVLDMGMRSDGRLQIWDARNRRVTLYEPDGSYSDEWGVQSGLFTSQATFLDAADHTYIKFVEERIVAGEAWKIGLLHFDAEGSLLELIHDPVVPGPLKSTGAFLEPEKVWTLGRDGTVVVGVSSSYEFEIRRPDGAVLRVQRAVEPLEVGDAEHQAYEAQREFSIRKQSQGMAQTPGETPWSKPSYRSLASDVGGRVWVWRYATVEPRSGVEPPQEGRPPPWPFTEPKIFDVFEPDGTYLGEVHAPSNVELYRFGPEALWGLRTGDRGESYVVRMHLRPADSDLEE